MKRVLKAEFPRVGRRRHATLMRMMGISAVAPQPGTSRRHRAHPVYPYYLVRHRTITAAESGVGDGHHVHPHGARLCLPLHGRDVIWASRRVLSSRVSVTLDSAFCIGAVEEAIAKYGCPEIFNTDHGAPRLRAPPSPACSTRTASRSAWMAKAAGATTSLKRPGARSNTKRSTCTPTTPPPPRPRGSRATSPLYNTRRPHSSLADQTPDEAYFTPLSIRKAA